MSTGSIVEDESARGITIAARHALPHGCMSWQRRHRPVHDSMFPPRFTHGAHGAHFEEIA